MKRKISVLLLLFALIFSLTACRALQLNKEKVKVTEKHDSNGATADNKDKTENNDTGKVANNNNPDDNSEILREETEENIKSIIGKRSLDVLTAIKNFDMDKLADAVHPDKGVRFSPYGYVDVENHLVFTAEEVRNLAADPKTYLWGYYDATGEPINLTFEDYYKKFIYDVDFVNAEQVGYNKILGHGNSLVNIFEVYKNSIFVEYYFSGFDPQYEGLDWRSLRLVFEKKNKVWYIVGIIHDQWTS